MAILKRYIRFQLLDTTTAIIPVEDISSIYVDPVEGTILLLKNGTSFIIVNDLTALTKELAKYKIYIINVPTS